jgi:hypothetical protein
MRALAIFGCLVFGGSCAAQTSVAPSAPDVAPFVSVSTATFVLEHVRVVDGTGAEANDDQAIVVADGKIQWIGPSSAVLDENGLARPVKGHDAMNLDAVAQISGQTELEEVRDGMRGNVEGIGRRRLENFYFGFVGNVDIHAGQLVRGIRLRAASAADENLSVQERRKRVLNVQGQTPGNVSIGGGDFQIEVRAFLENLVNDAVDFNALAVFLSGRHLHERNATGQRQGRATNNFESWMADLRGEVQGFGNAGDFHQVAGANGHIGLAEFGVKPDSAGGILTKSSGSSGS